jgi:hypothetical protein
MEPNFQSCLPKSVQSHRWTFELALEGWRNAPPGARLQRPPARQGLLPLTDLLSLKKILSRASDGDCGGTDVHVQSHQAGVLQRSHQLPSKGQQPWGLEKQDVFENDLARENGCLKSGGGNGKDELARGQDHSHSGSLEEKRPLAVMLGT